MNADHQTPSSALTYPCPHCKTPSPWSGNPYRPFCSERCKLIDLGEWASESYAIAAEDSPLSGEIGD